MINYLLINIILSTSALAINQWLQIPYRIRFYTLMIAVIAWFIPFGLLSIEISQKSAAMLPAQIIETSQPMAVVNQMIDKPIDYTVLFVLLLMTGMVLFIRDLILSHKFITQLKPTSTPFNGHERIRTTEHINGAFVSGYFKPIVWIDSNLKHCKTLSTVITHELQHIKNHDQFWLFITSLAQRLFWFNPLSFLLCHQCKKSIELRCDEDCKAQIGQHQYQTHLAQLVIDLQQNNHALMNNQINPNQGFNIHRIKQLEQENTMTRFKTAQLSIIVLSALLLSTLSLITAAQNTTFTTLAEDQILLQLEMRLNDEDVENLKLITRKGKMANVTYANHDFGFTAQVVPNQPNQIFTEVIISKIKNGQKIEVAKPAIMAAEAEWAGIKFTEGAQNFDIKLMAQTSQGGGQIPVPPKPTAAPITAPTPVVAPTPPSLTTERVSINTPNQPPKPLPAPKPTTAPTPPTTAKAN